MAKQAGVGDLFDRVGEMIDLVKRYAKQEIVDPVRDAGRWVGFGVAGSVLLTIGSVELMLATLRALQTETGTALTGNLSWVPYLAVLLGGAVVCLLLVRRITKEPLA